MPKPVPIERVVGIGASAGGLEALEEFFAPLKPGSTAFVIAQHLAPDRPSLIVELLSRRTSLQVVEAVDGAQLTPGVVAIGPPNRDLTIVSDRLRLVEPPDRLGPSPNIDLLLESLAESWGDKSVAVVLSGTGSDGAHGMRSVRSVGGLTLVQSPESARFDGMPRAAIALGGIDLVADARVLGDHLAALTPRSGTIEDSVALTGDEALPTIIARIKTAIGIDFSGYKESTLRRQMQRRMAIWQIADIDDYLVRLAVDVDEVTTLAGNLLVNVTSFFRDPDAFDALRRELVTYLDRPDTGEALRVWVPGCATGEEVYTIAMLVSEILGRPSDLASRLKIFGTDLDEASLAIARRAAYPLSALPRIPGPLREAYVKETSEGFHIADVLRMCAVFAKHDVGTDPPFPRIDLVSCRNTLIYFKNPRQRRVITMIGFALRPGGLLLLGNAETLDRRTPGFRVIDSDHRIFMRTGEPSPSFASALTTPDVRNKRPDRPVVKADGGHRATETRLEQHAALLEAVLRQGNMAMLILDSEHRLIEVIGDVGPYCRVGEGTMTGAVMSFLRPEFQAEARALLLLCRTDPEPVVGQSIRPAGLDRAVHVIVSKVQVSDTMFTLMVFEPDPIDAPAPSQPNRAESFDHALRRLEQELLVSQETLRRSMSELQALNEELEASSEELQAASEELQASNEELHAANDELQATNEELDNLNQELTQRSDDLEALNTDLKNIQNSLSQGMVIVNRNLDVTMFTPVAVRVFGLLDSDIGRPLLSTPTTMEIPGFEVALRSVVNGGPRVSIEGGNSRASYLVHVLPYRAPDGHNLGAIVTLTDVSEMVDLRTITEQAFSDLQNKSELLEHEATFDSITGLVKRGRFSQLLTVSVSRAERDGTHIALAWIDLDRFKEVNDAYGHEAGDITLRQIGQRVLSGVRASDAVGRLGGDEIGVLITGYGTTSELDIILERFVTSAREVVTANGEEIHITASVGVAIFPDDARDPRELMRAADAAMYTVKSQGGDGYAYFDASMNDAAWSRRARRQQIAAAIENDEFVMHYQPIVDATSGAVWGVESLVRWRSGDSLIAAADFVPFCEESGQIRALGILTMGLVLADTAALRAAGYPDLRIAFNMSVTQLEHRQFADTLKEYPGPDGLRGIVIEIIESVFLPDHEKALQALDALSSLGAEKSIDDYGSGYSNVRLLETLDPDYIKLDRSFLSEHHSAESRTALVRSAVEVSHVVGALVVAEGIETHDQHRLVADAGVDFIQGNWVARPMPLSDILEWLANDATQR